MDSGIVQAAMAEAEATGTLSPSSRWTGSLGEPVCPGRRSTGGCATVGRSTTPCGRPERTPAAESGCAERAIAAATEVIVADGVAALTVEGSPAASAVRSARCYAAFGDREGLLAAVFDRHAPLPTVVELLAADPERSPTSRPACGRSTRRCSTASVTDDTAVLQALFAEMLAKPNGIGAQLFRDRILPRITANGRRLAERADTCRSLRRPTALAA